MYILCTEFNGIYHARPHNLLNFTEWIFAEVGFPFPDVVVVDPTLDPDHALPGVVNAPLVVNEAVIVTETPGEKGNGNEHAHPHGHAQHHPRDQRHGHAPVHQQQSSVIKKRNRVVDKVAQLAPTELCDTEKLSLPMLSTGAHIKCI